MLIALAAQERFHLSERGDHLVDPTCDNRAARPNFFVDSGEFLLEIFDPASNPGSSEADNLSGSI
jgi:hypothetical protein